MSGACGLSALYSYSSLNNPRMAGIKAALGLTYLFAGRQLVTGNPKLGYDLGSISSLALVRTLLHDAVRLLSHPGLLHSLGVSPRVCQYLQLPADPLCGNDPSEKPAIAGV
jgi:hypothetical protein